MLYDKKNNVVRTTRINSIFSQISIQSSISEENKKGNLLSDCLLGSSVGLPGFEPRQTEPKTVVLPLHNNPIRIPTFQLGCENIGIRLFDKIKFKNLSYFK